LLDYIFTLQHCQSTYDLHRKGNEPDEQLIRPGPPILMSDSARGRRRSSKDGLSTPLATAPGARSTSSVLFFSRDIHPHFKFQHLMQPNVGLVDFSSLNRKASAQAPGRLPVAANSETVSNASIG